MPIDCTKRLSLMTTRPMRSRSRYLLRQTLSLLFALLILDGDESLSADRFETIVSGAAARSLSPNDLYWVDNGKLLFLGRTVHTDNSLNRAPRDASLELLLWDTDLGRLTRLLDVSPDAQLCVGGRFVRLQFKRGTDLVVRSGLFGEPMVEEVHHGEEGRSLNPLTCREYDRRQVRARYGDRALPLISEGEYLLRPALRSNDPIRYVPNEQEPAIPVPQIPNRSVLSVPRWSEYLERYVFNAFRPRPDPTKGGRVWTLDRAGRAEEVVIPSGPWLASRVVALPIFNGWAFTSTATALNQRPDAAGIYVLRDDMATKVIGGLPHAFAVSSSGCIVAVSIDTRLLREALPIVHAINVCERGAPWH